MTMPAKREQQDVVDQKRWLAYAAAGAASALVCQGAEASSIIHVTVNQVLDSSGGATTSNSLAFGVGQASSASIFFSHLANTSSGAAYFGASGAGAQIAGFTAGAYPYAFNLDAGQNVSTVGGFLSGSGTMAFTSGFGNSQFLDAGTGFLGFQFDGGAGAQYGWARVDMSGSPINSFTIVDYAYADIGQSITAGQTVVPLPGALGLFASGAAGLALLRGARRRKRQKQA